MSLGMSEPVHSRCLAVLSQRGCGCWDQLTKATHLSVEVHKRGCWPGVWVALHINIGACQK